MPLLPHITSRRPKVCRSHRPTSRAAHQERTLPTSHAPRPPHRYDPESVPAQAHGARLEGDRGAADPAAHRTAGDAGTGGRSSRVPPGVAAFNDRSATDAERTLLTCCASRSWSGRIVAHRPYPDLDALLAASDEACYDLPADELARALAAEPPAAPEEAEVPRAALTALTAAHVAYESRFGHPFVISLDGYGRAERLDQILSGLRTRLGNDPDDERATAAEELRRLARSRIAHLVGAGTEAGAQAARDVTRTDHDAPRTPDSGRSASPSDRPYVPV
ncbi:OHCU decarboxylase [Streptomyces sp. YIM 130001]|uniref:2-oxo-4-hydroxy-4-carboxy-5-ureidoimidazoline decarboxylase n=1 Tax=Streptomyces sp. YIM 130001 TaxID=2259644 RepID=UPI000ECEF3EC|nr:OHCU decarboxylase [Streptomyces sp. YIM 130001]